MTPQSCVRLAGIFLLVVSYSAWFYLTQAVYFNYLDLINQEPIVMVSILTLWVPVGMLGALVVLTYTAPKALYYGKKVNEMYSPKAIQAASKLCIYFAIAGIIFAIGWTYHSLDLLDKYGYEYNDKLTKITPTGIHLIYVKSKN